MKSQKIVRKPSLSLIILCVVLALYTIIFFIPIFWAVFTAFKEYKFYGGAVHRKNVKYLLGFNHLTFQNIMTALTEFKMPYTYESMYEMFGNSLLYAGGCALVSTMVPCVIAYLVARYNFFLGKIVSMIVLITMAVPIIGALPSEIKMVDNIGLLDSVFGLYVLKANFLGIYFLVFYAQFKGIPKDYTEAAEIDGASEWYIMGGIIFPIAIGTITTVMLLMFISFWNDYQTPMVYWKSHPVLAYGLLRFVKVGSGGKGLGTIPVKLATMLVVAFPIIVLFGIFNKKIMANMSIGGIKG